MEILRVENLCKVFGVGEAKVTALDNISFSVDRGEFVSIVGQSGSGKSSLLHLIGGMDSPTGGRILVEGKEVLQKNQEELAVYRRRKVGLIYQFFNLIPVLNVEENIVLPLRLDGKKIEQERVNELLDVLGLSDRRMHLPKQLSGGQQQRVSIGRAMISAPVLVLADEPTGNLDKQTGKEIVELLKNSNRKYEQTLILVTHDEGLALQADRMIRLQDGKIISDERLR